MIFVILVVQLIEFPQTAQFRFLLLQQGILHQQIVHLLLQTYILFQKLADLHQLILAPGKPAPHLADPLLEGDHHITHGGIQRTVENVRAESQRHQHGTQTD